MSDTSPVYHGFRDGNGGVVQVALPFALDALCAEYDEVTARMARRAAPPAFSRDEWGYLLGFMRGSALRAVFTQGFGPASDELDSMPVRIARPRAHVAIWLPNNVSLLGPLTTTLCLLTGAHVRAKAGTGSENLTAHLRDEILENGAGPILTRLWQQNLTVEQFDRHDPRNADWSSAADARIFFGSDAAALSVESLPHKPGTPFFAFADHSSLVWADPAALDDAALTTLLRVFRIYGKAGCTSPQSLVLIDAEPKDAIATANRLKELSDAQTGTNPPVHIASDSFMADQVARANGWHAVRTANGDAVFVAGAPAPEDLPGLMSLSVIAQPREEALATLPDEIQTVGHIADPDRLRDWALSLSASRALRFVPVQQMHHFGPFWDGQPFWRGLFQDLDIRI
ncbi:acyl-CoA reductase [Ruegeria sp. HKCCD7255]|uniref:acyl-CoA reductase n=1 Tax=Ruegeria sp. HKCCD7255 TaxID=2683004 RepID=UPI001489F042|nr:acyl-CoA reductase [Ruegeria sp. HKCCD7255]